MGPKNPRHLCHETLKRFQELLQIIHLVDERLPKDQAQTGAVVWLVGWLVSFFVSINCVFFLNF